MRYEFRGDAGERGRQHGRTLREQIRDRITRALPADAGVRAGLAEPWLAAIDRLGGGAPLGAELRGIAAGARVPVPDIVLLNAFEAFEVAWQVELGGCTAVALAGPDGALVAQNWDANPRWPPRSGSTSTADPTCRRRCCSPHRVGWGGSA